MNIDPAIEAFAKNMQTKLDRNKNKECPEMNPDGKGRHWSQVEISWLLLRLREETIELEKALSGANFVDVMDEAADVGNFAMMIHDQCRRAATVFAADNRGSHSGA